MTAAPKFTPGSWHVGDDGLIENESDWTIARCGSPFPFDTTNDERDANARLIAAAPELYEALIASRQALNDWLHVYAPEHCREDDVAAARARINESGTLAYIANVQATIRAALAKVAP